MFGRIYGQILICQKIGWSYYYFIICFPIEEIILRMDVQIKKKHYHVWHIVLLVPEKKPNYLMFSVIVEHGYISPEEIL